MDTAGPVEVGVAGVVGCAVISFFSDGECGGGGGAAPCATGGATRGSEHGVRVGDGQAGLSPESESCAERRRGAVRPGWTEQGLLFTHSPASQRSSPRLPLLQLQLKQLVWLHAVTSWKPHAVIFLCELPFQGHHFCPLLLQNLLLFQGKIIFDRFDPDDKMGFTVVDNVDGYFNVEGCGDDFDWIPGIKNRPEVSIGHLLHFRITHWFSGRFFLSDAFLLALIFRSTCACIIFVK